MKSNLLTLILCLAAASGWSAIPKGWSTDLNASLKTAKEKNKPVLLYFTADWCGPCKQMAANTFPNADVQAAFNSFEKVAIDVDAQGSVAQKYKVNGIPAFVILSKDGKEVKRTVGYQQPKGFSDWLKENSKTTAAVEAREEAFLVEKASLEKSLNTSSPEEIAKALPGLFALCADKDPEKKEFAVQQLKPLAVSQPRLLLPGLEHPKLATRIEIQKLLASQHPAAKQVDPWQGTKDRQEAVQALAAKLP